MGDGFGVSHLGWLGIGRRGMLVFALVGLVLGWLAESAPISRAAFAGRNGRIAFVASRGRSSCGAIFTINPDGSGLRRLVGGCPWKYSDPAFSADGDRIVFLRRHESSRHGSRGDGICVMDADGAFRLIIHSASAGDPSFSPNGKWIVFDAAVKRGRRDIFIAAADGSGVRQLTHGSAAAEPRFSPDGDEIVFTRGANVYTMDVNGSHVHQLTHAPQGFLYSGPDFSPDGRRVVFESGTDVGFDVFHGISVVRANGAHPHGLVSSPTSRLVPDDPVFSPNGRRIAFMAVTGCRHGRKCPQRCRHVSECDPGPMFLYTMKSDGTHLRRIVLVGTYQTFGAATTVTWQALH